MADELVLADGLTDEDKAARAAAIAVYYEPLKKIWPTVAGDGIEQKLATLNAMTSAGPLQPISVATATNYLRTTGAWYAIKKAVGISDAAYAAVDLVEDLRVQTIDLSQPIVTQMGLALVTEKLMSQAQWDGLLALASTSIPWWQSNGYKSPIGEGDLEAVGGSANGGDR